MVELCGAEKVISEARARIIWGEPHAAVCKFLISNGVPETEAAAQIRKFKRERNHEIRRRGFRNTLIGGAFVGTAGILLYLAFGGAEFAGDAQGVGCAIAAGLYGVWKLTNGILYLLRPQSEDAVMDDMPG